MNHDPEFDPEAENAIANDEAFSEQAIEDAYLQALMASDEAGLSPEVGFEAMAISAPVAPEESELTEAESTDQDQNQSEQTKPKESRFEYVNQAPARPAFTPQQIIESVLFVGGEKLSARKLSNLLGSRTQEEKVREWIDQINQRYEKQGRPYDIQLGELGYQMVLKSEFQTQRNQVFGIGPREVRLSQDAIAVLSFIAYQQPVTKEQIKEIDDEKSLTSLRQLIRRELVAVSRPEDSDETVYHVTDRFLKLFNLNSLEDLPRAEELSFK